MARNAKKDLDLESELFALVNSITQLHKKYREGFVNENFFNKTLRNAVKELTKIELLFKERNINFSELLIRINLIEDYNRFIAIFNEFSFSDFNNNKNEEPKLSVLELPKITSEITSSFITLMDALKLEALSDSDLIVNLFKELNKNLKKFPGLEELTKKIKGIFTKVITSKQDLFKNVKYREQLVDELYRVFKDFQNALNMTCEEK